MIEIINSALNAVGSLPVAVLPDGAGFWLGKFGVTALIGGIVSGIGLAMSIRIVMFFLSPIKRLLGI